MTSCFVFLQATAPVWDLRSPTGLPGEFPENGDSNGGTSATTSPATSVDESQPATSASPSLRRTSGKIGSGAGGNTEPPPATMTVVEFTRVWWDHNSGAHSRLSVWRPVCPSRVRASRGRGGVRAAAARVHDRRAYAAAW